VQSDCETNHNNGACAAFAATAARLGQLDSAWKVVLASYDRGSSWALPTACRTMPTQPTCTPEATVTFQTYPEALRWFLGEGGYAPKVYLAAADATGPSFPCASVTSGVLKLVCAVPDLAKADRNLAELYGRALALSPDPAATRDAERQFIQTRNNAPPDAFTLYRLYEARLAVLLDVR
jgi:hypothetical protein